MVLQIKTKNTLFAAYPWSIYIQSVYEDIFKTLFKNWNIRHGSNVTLKDANESNVEKFLNRNKHLYDVFVSAIESSDFFIADVTGANPNVMLELGIAIQLNKNILIVSSDSLEKLPFDIKGFRASYYKSKDELIKIIKDELKIYLMIKAQTLLKHFDKCYFNFPSEGELKHGQVLMLPIPQNIKNFRLKVEYKFKNTSNSRDWFGIHLRALLPDISISELIYVRSNLSLESVTFPGKRSVQVGEDITSPLPPTDDGFKKIELIINENTLKAITNDHKLDDKNIQRKTSGKIILHAYGHYQPKLGDLLVCYRNIEIVSLDTTTSTYS